MNTNDPGPREGLAALFFLFVTVIFFSVGLGGAVPIMDGLANGEDRRPTSGVFGTLEVTVGLGAGLCWGVFLAAIFTGGVAIITRPSGCRYGFGILHFLIVVAGALLGWCLGGLVGSEVNKNNPALGSPFTPILAWRSGAQPGMIFGSLFAVPPALALLYVNWRRGEQPEEQPVLGLEPAPQGLEDDEQQNPRTGIVSREDGYCEDLPE